MIGLRVVHFLGPCQARIFLWLIFTLLFPGVTRANDAPPGLEPGILFSCRTLEPPKSDPDVAILPSAALYVPRGQSPTPFVPPGPFVAEWSGFVSVELRGEYVFQAELSGQLTMEINGQRVLTADHSGTHPSESVRLNKGTNSLHAMFTAPADADASLRLNWIPKGGLPTPVPSQALSHSPDAPGVKRGRDLRLGRELFLEHRCARCHTPATPPLPNTELNMDAPSFEGIGSRLEPAWMADWISNPKQLRATARMPRLFHGHARQQSEAMAIYLSSLKAAESQSVQTLASEPIVTSTGPGDDARGNGKRRFDDLHCQACHDLPDATETDRTRIPLKLIAQKFTAGALVEFLQRPEAHFAWSRMPDFKLSRVEAGELAACLLGASTNAEPRPGLASRPEQLTKGRELVQTTGCLNCHSLNLENKFAAKSLDALPTNRWDKGCVARIPDGAAPFFGFSEEERSALQSVATAKAALTREVPTEFAERHLRSLRCGECHGKFDGFPSVPAMEGKLKPEWAKAFVGGELSYRPRSWLPARMPAFARRAQALATGMAMLHGFPPATPPEPPADPAAAAVGQKLVAAQGGLSCISCHAIAQVPATQVFENAGINLAYAHARLLKTYFERWVRNPLAIDPVSKMPVFFDEELRSPLTEFYDGDGLKQIDALWQYIRLGDKMPPPPGTETAP